MLRPHCPLSAVGGPDSSFRAMAQNGSDELETRKGLQISDPGIVLVPQAKKVRKVPQSHSPQSGKSVVMSLTAYNRA